MKKRLLIVMGICVVVAVAAVIFYMPQKMNLPDTTVFHIRMGDKSVWIEEEGECAELREMVASIRLRRELLPFHPQSAQGEDYLYLDVYDAGNMIYGMPEHLGDYTIICSRPGDSRFDWFGGTFRCRLLASDEKIEQLIDCITQLAEQ